jgi:general nucleoside transport system permease protein
MSQGQQDIPRWLDVGVVPLLNLAIALVAAGLVVALVGQSPTEVISALVKGALGTQRGLSYTLYYATTFTFTGLAVAVAFHAGLFNIGGEGQAMLGGLGAGLVALWLAPGLPGWAVLPLMVLGAAAFACVWALVPAYLQAYRGSHIVITTIMFNFLASSLMVYLLVNVLKPAGEMNVQSAIFAASAKMPGVHQVLGWVGIAWPSSPLNLSVLMALVAAVGVYLLLWKTRIGYQLRASGASQGAAVYAGITPQRQVLIAMGISGALAGMVAMNEVSGVHGKLLPDFVSGAGFTGIAVALMGRNHPVGIVMASLLFGMIFQGGAEVAFEVKDFTRDMVVMLQGFIVLFSGAMAYATAPLVARIYHRLRGNQHSNPPTLKAKEAAHG